MAKTKTKSSKKRDFTDNAFCNYFKNLWQKFTETPFGKKTVAHFNKQGYLYFSFFVPALLFFMVFILQGTYPFGKGSVLVLDLNGQYVYFFEALRKAIYGDASLLYSWCGTLGAEFIGIYAYYIASPLSYIVALFPEGAMTEALLTIELVKCGLCGLTMAYYLKKTRPRANEMITITIAVMYALSGYAIVMAHNTMWIDAIIWLPLLTYGIERLINYGHFKLFIVALAMTVISNFYIGFMICFYVFLYFFYYYFFASHRGSTAVGEIEKGNNNFIGERFHFLRSLTRIGSAAVIALLISAFIILPTYYSLTLGKTTFSDPSWEFVLSNPEGAEKLLFKFNPFDFIAKLMIASYDSVRPTGLPFLYCGMLTLILVPIYFLSKRVNFRQKLGAGLILTIYFLFMIIAPVDMLLHGAQEPNWLNYRYSFVFSFLLLILAHRALELFHTIKLKKTLIIAGVWAGLVLLATPFVKDMFKTPEVSYIRRLLLFILLPLALLAIYAAAHHYILQERKNPIMRTSMITTLAIIVCLEAFVGTLLNTTSLNEDVTFSPKYTNIGLEGYDNFLDRFRPIVNAVQDSDDGFYRMEKAHGNDHVRKYADNFALNMRGLTGSTSTLNERTITFLDRLGYISYSNVSSHKGATSVGDALLGIKYLITDTDRTDDGYFLEAYKVLSDTQGLPTNIHEYENGKYLYSYENLYALSIAYLASSDIKDYNITTSPSPFVTMNNLITALLGKDTEVFKEIRISKSNIAVSDNVNMETPNYLVKEYDKDGNRIPKTNSKGEIIYNGTEPTYTTRSVAYYSFTRKEGATGNMEITITFTVPEGVKEGTEILFKLPTDYPREAKWTFTTSAEDSTELKGSCFISSDKTDCILSLGRMNAGEVGTLKLTVEGDNFYFEQGYESGAFYYVDEEAYREAFETLAEGNFKIEDYTESYFKGSINVTEGKNTVFTTIPYEKYWNVYVDGEAVETYMTCAALLAFDIEETGEHSVVIEYVSEPLNFGIKLGVVGLTLLAGWVTLDCLWFRKKRLASCTLDYDCLSELDYISDGYDEEILDELKKQRRREKKHRGK